MFSDEKMILDIRLNVLNEYIDHFVIVESKYKHDGSIKSKNFDIDQFSKFKNKISYIYVDKEPKKWDASKPIEVTRPEFEWEGANLPIQYSSRSSINTPVNQLRDPCVFQDEGKLYLLYSVKGENGIAISTLEIN